MKRGPCCCFAGAGGWLAKVACGLVALVGTRLSATIAGLAAWACFLAEGALSRSGLKGAKMESLLDLKGHCPGNGPS